MSTDPKPSNTDTPEPPDTVPTGIERDYVKMPPTPDSRLRFSRLEETLEVSAGIQASNVEQIFTAFEAIEQLSSQLAESHARFDRLIDQIEKDREENKRRFNALMEMAKVFAADIKRNSNQ